MNECNLFLLPFIEEIMYLIFLSSLILIDLFLLAFSIVIWIVVSGILFDDARLTWWFAAKEQIIKSRW